MSKNMARLLRFAIRYRGWHTLGGDPADRRAMDSLAAHGLLEIVRHPRPSPRVLGAMQFRLRSEEGRTYG